MMNYMKSEMYRILNTKGFALMIGIFCGLILLMNVVNAIALKKIPDFPYGTTDFSFGMLTSDPTILLYITLIIGSVVFGDANKNNTLKNVVAFGITRKQIFFGKYIVSILASFICLGVVLIAYVGSTYALLENSGVEHLQAFFRAIGGSLPGCLAALILTISLFLVIENAGTVTLIWVSLMTLIPTVLALVGSKVELIHTISRWIPYCALKEVERNPVTRIFMGPWDTTEGLTRCIVGGAIAILIFGAYGLLGFQKKDIR